MKCWVLTDTYIQNFFEKSRFWCPVSGIYIPIPFLNRTPPDTRKTKTLSVDKKPDTTKTEIYCFSSILLSGGVWFTTRRIEVFGGMLPYMLLSNTNASKASSYPYIGFCFSS